QRTPTYPLPGVALGSLLTCLGAFGGNVLACLVTGTRNMVLTEFVVWPAAVAAWVLVGGRFWAPRPGRAFSLRDLLSLPVAHHLLVFLSEAFRASLLCSAIDVARTVAPLVAPETAPSEGWTLVFLAGVLAACGGIFLPGDRGLSSLSAGVPWSVQSALYGTDFYCYCCLSGGFAGHSRAMVSLFFVSVALVQTSRRGGGPHFNPYSLLHRVAYAVLGLDKPPAPVPAPLLPALPGSSAAAAAVPREFDARDNGGGRRGVEHAGGTGAGTLDGSWNATAAAAGAGFAAGSGMSASRHRRSDESHRLSSIASSRRGRGRGTRGSLARGLGSGSPARGRSATMTTGRGRFARCVVGVWGPGKVGARGAGRALVWTAAAVAVVVMSRLLALSTLSMDRTQPASHEHRQHEHQERPWRQPPTAGMPFEGVGGGGTPEKFPDSVAGGVDGVVGGAPAGAGAGAAGARKGGIRGWYERFRGGAKDTGENSGSPPSPPARAEVEAGAEDLAGMDPTQLIEQVMAARKAAVEAADRADAAELAAAQLAIASEERTGASPGAAAAGGGRGGTDGSGAGLARRSEGGEEASEREREGLREKPVDRATAAAAEQSKALFGAAVEDYSSVVGEFSEVSKAWLEEVAVANPSEVTGDDVKVNRQAGEDAPFQEAKRPHAPIKVLHEQPPHELSPDRAPLDDDNLGEEAGRISPSPSSTATDERPPGLAVSSTLDHTSPEGTGEDASGSAAGALEPAVPGATAAAAAETAVLVSPGPWFQRFFGRPADVDEGLVTNLAPGGGDTALVRPGLPEDVVDVGDDVNAAELEQAVPTLLSLPENVLSAPESMTSGRAEDGPDGNYAPGDGGGGGGGGGTSTGRSDEDAPAESVGGDAASTGEAGDVGDSDAVGGDGGTGLHVSDPNGYENGVSGSEDSSSVEAVTAHLEEGGMADLPGRGVVPPEDSSHIEEGSGGEDETSSGEGIGAEDVATITDDDVFADGGSEGDVALGDDPEVEVGGVASLETDFAGGGDDAASVSPGVEANGESDMVASTAGVGAFKDGRGGLEDSGSADGSITGVGEGGDDDSALSIGDDEASVVPTADDDAGDPAGQSSPHRSWLPWRRHRPADVDEDPLANLAPAGDGADRAGPDLPEDVVDMGADDDASLEQTVSTPPSLPESGLSAFESIKSGGGEDNPDGTDDPDSGGSGDGDGGGGGGGISTTGLEEAAAQLGEGGASDVADPPGQDGILPEEVSYMKEGSGEGDETQKDEEVVVTTTTDEDDVADGSGGDFVPGDDPEGGPGGVASMEAGLAGGGDGASGVSPPVATNDDGPATSGSDDDTAFSTAEVGDLADKHDATGDSGSNGDTIAVLATGGEASAVSTGDDEASGVQTADGGAGADEGETRPRRSWLPWRRHQPADVDEDPFANLAPAGDAAALAGLDLAEDEVDVGDDDDASLEQAVQSLPESVFLPPEDIVSGRGEDRPDGTDAPDDGGGSGGVDGDAVPTDEAGDVSDDTDGGDENQNDEGVGAGDVTTTTDEDGFADVGSEGDVVMGDDPEGGEGGVTTTGAGVAGGDDDASTVPPAVDGSSSAGDESTTGVGALADGHDATADVGSNDGAVGVSVADGEASAASTDDDEASGGLTTDGDAGADEGETRPRRSWLPWRRHRPADVDEDPLTSLAPAGDATALAGPDLPEGEVDVGDDDDAAESAPLTSPEKVVLASESIASGRGEDIPDGTDAPDEGGGGVDDNAVPTGEAGVVSDGDVPDAVIRDVDTGLRASEGGGRIENGMDGFGEGSSVEAEAVEAAAARLGEAGASDPPGQDGAFSEESSHMEEGIDGGGETQGDEGVEDGDVATTSDEDGFADVGDEGDVVLGDDLEGGAGSITSMGDGLAGGGDDASRVSPDVETNADGPSSAGSVSTAGVGTLVDGRDDAADFGSADGAIAAAAGDGEASAVSTGDDEASGVSSTDGDADVDQGETRPRRSWLPWRRHRPADVEEDPMTSFAPAGDDAALAGSDLPDDAGLDLPDDVIDVGDDLTAAALEQQVVSTPSSLPESFLLASESAMNGGEDVSTGEAGDVGDGDDRDAGDPVTGDLDLGPHVNLEGGGRTSDVADPPGQDGTLFDESSHMEEGLADDAILSGAAGDGEASALSISDDEVLDVSSTDGDHGIVEGETRPRRSWLPWRRHQPAAVDQDPVANLAPPGDGTALASSDLPDGVVDVGEDDDAALEQAMLRLSESVLLASESITDGGEDVSAGEDVVVSDGDDREPVTGDIGPGLHVNLEEGRIGGMADLPGQNAVLPEESSRTDEGSAGGDGAWGGEDAQDGDLATITDEDVFADVSNEGDVVLGDDPEGGAGGVSSMGAGLTGGDEDASSASPAVDTDANDPATSGGVSTADGPLPGGDDVIDDSGLADDAIVAVVADDEEALALSVGGDEASGVPTADGDAGAPAVQSIPRRSWLPWRRHRPADVDEDPATNLAPAGDDADLAGPDLPEDVVDVGDGDDAALEPAESTPLSLPKSALLASESATNDESSPDDTDAPDRGGGVTAGASELAEDAAAEYANGDPVPPTETGDLSDRDGPDAVAGDIGPGGGYETGPDGFGESSSVEIAAAHLGEAGTGDMADPQEQVGALSEESNHMEEGSVGRDETGSLGDDQDGGVAMIPDEEDYADVDSESHAVLGDDPEGRTGGVTNTGAGLAGGSNDVSSVSPAIETEADDSSTSGEGDSAVPIDAEDSPLVDGQDDAADSGLADDAIIAGAAGDGEASALSIGHDEASGVSGKDVDAGVDEGETRPRRSWLPWRRHRPADVDEGPVTNLVPAGDDSALAGSDPPEDVVDMGDGDEAALEQASLSLPQSVLLASESSTNGGDDVSTGEDVVVSDGDDPEPVTGDLDLGPHVDLEGGGTGDMPHLPGQDGALSDEGVNMEEGSDGGDKTQSDEAVKAGDIATTTDEDLLADVGDEGDAVLGDDPEGGASVLTSMGAGLARAGDDASSVSPALETNADGRATFGSDSDSAITTAEVCALRGGYYATGDSGSNVGGMCVLTTDGDASAVSTGDDEASGVSSKDGDADVDAGETRPRRSWFPWRRSRPADVDEDPVANLAPAGDDAGLAGSDLPDDVVDVGEDNGAALEQAVLSLSESMLSAAESITDGGEDVSAGEAGDVSDEDDREAVAGDLAPTSHVDLEDGGTSDMADPPVQDGALSEEISHMEEGSVGDDNSRSGEDAKAGDETTTTDEDDVALDGDEGDAVLGDDPEGGAGGFTSMGDGLSGGDDDASSVPPVVEAGDYDSSTSSGEGDSAVSIDAEVSALMDGQDAAADSGAADGAVGAEGGESSAVFTADREALGDSSKDGDAGDDEGETHPRRSWLPWRRHRPVDVDEDTVTNLVPAVDDTALAGPGLPEDMVDVGDDDDASLEQAVSTPSSLPESVLLTSESAMNGGEDVSTGEAGDVSDGDDPDPVSGDTSPDPRGSDGGGDDMGDDLDDVGENTSVETFTADSEEGARDTTDPPGPDGEFPDESSHVEEGPGAGHGAGNGEHAKAGDVATIADESGFADDGSESHAALGDDPEGGAAGVMRIGAGLTGGDNDASGVYADVAIKADDPATSGGYGDSAVSTAEVGD
ncbi:unnamed protein product, partial [Ectocarpus sp. 12 AP-2014]